MTPSFGTLPVDLVDIMERSFSAKDKQPEWTRVEKKTTLNGTYNK